MCVCGTKNKSTGGCVKLRDYQETAADFLYEHDRAMILAPVGAGKTAITLTAMQAILKDGYAMRFQLCRARVCPRQRRS